MGSNSVLSVPVGIALSGAGLGIAGVKRRRDRSTAHRLTGRPTGAVHRVPVGAVPHAQRVVNLHHSLVTLCSRLGGPMLLLRRGVRGRTTPIGALHRAIMRWGETERTSSRLAVQPVGGWRRVCRRTEIRPFADFWTRNEEGAGRRRTALSCRRLRARRTSPLHGYVGQVLNHSSGPESVAGGQPVPLRGARPGTSWTTSSAARRTRPDLVTCGIGATTSWRPHRSGSALTSPVRSSDSRPRLHGWTSPCREPVRRLRRGVAARRAASIS